MSIKYDNSMSGAAFEPKSNGTIDLDLVERGIWEGSFQLKKKATSKRWLVLNMKGKNKEAVVLDKDGTTELFRAKVEKIKNRTSKAAPRFFTTFGQQRVVFFKKTTDKGTTYWQLVKGKSVDLGEHPDINNLFTA